MTKSLPFTVFYAVLPEELLKNLSKKYQGFVCLSDKNLLMLLLFSESISPEAVLNQKDKGSF